MNNIIGIIVLLGGLLLLPTAWAASDNLGTETTKSITSDNLRQRQQKNQSVKIPSKLRLKKTKTWIDPVTGMKFVWIESGCFMMGSSASEPKRNPDERQHQVCIEKGYWMGQYEVTQQQWEKVMEENPSSFKGGPLPEKGVTMQDTLRFNAAQKGEKVGKYELNKQQWPTVTGDNPSANKIMNLPVDSVTWPDTLKFIDTLNHLSDVTYRLPTEAEWEYAARAGTTTPFYTGNCISIQQANFDGGPYDTFENCGPIAKKDHTSTNPVGSYPANPWGLYDMVGNVNEWTCSEYNAFYDGRENKCKGKNHTRRAHVVVRGSSWNAGQIALRSAMRLRMHPSNTSGFRLIKAKFKEIHISPFKNHKPPARLTVQPSPNRARVRILNVEHEYYQGIALKPGRYRIEVTAPGYQRNVKWLKLKSGNRIYSVNLKQNKSPTRIKRWTEPITGMKFVWIEPGCFMMGSPASEPERYSDERQHQVCIDKGYWMGQHEVTQEQWRAIWLLRTKGSAFSRKGYIYDGKNRPVDRTSWNQAQHFIEILNRQSKMIFRLPTESEWEYAARAGTATPFYTGTCINTEQANYDGNYDYNGCGAKTDVLRGEMALSYGNYIQYPPNPWGLYDMAGSVWEWTCSEYNTSYDGHEKKCIPKSQWKNKNLSPNLANTVPVSTRGGSWENRARGVRSAYRLWYEPGEYALGINPFFFVGFRLIREN